MRDTLEMANNGQHRQHRFNEHSGIPLTTFAQLQVSGMPIRFAKVRVSKNKHHIGNAIDQMLKSRTIIYIGSGTIPSNDQTKMVQQHRQLTTDNPAEVR